MDVYFEDMDWDRTTFVGLSSVEWYEMKVVLISLTSLRLGGATLS